MTEDFFVESIYGAHTKQGIVQVEWSGKQFQLSILDAKKIAYLILEAAEAASTDEVLIHFFEKLIPDKAVLGGLLMEFRKQRGKTDPRFFES